MKIPKIIQAVVSSPKRRRQEKRMAALAKLPQPIAALTVGLTTTIGEAILVLTQATTGLAVGAPIRIPFETLKNMLEESYGVLMAQRLKREALEKTESEADNEDTDGE